MTEREDIVAAVVAAAGGELTGRVRLQKAVYLLDRLGFNSGSEFEYHHYGPFSRELDNTTADAKAFGLIEEEFDRRQSDGASYGIFKLKREPTSRPYGKREISKRKGVKVQGGRLEKAVELLKELGLVPPATAAKA